MVSNTVGISTCRNNEWSIHYFHRKDPVSGAAQPIFDSATSKFRYWPLDGIIYRGRLYEFLIEIEVTGKGAFDFREIGATLAEVINPRDEPDRWNIRYHHLSSETGLAVGASAIVEDHYVYLFSIADRIAPGKHQILLARLPLEHLDSPAANLEHLSMQGNWKPGLNLPDSKVLVDERAPDFSVRFHPAISKWLMVQTDSAFPAHTIGIRVADHLEGRWSSFTPLYNIPEMNPAAPSSSIFCYAAKEHIEFAPSPNSTLITYACNSLSFSHLASDMTLYYPIAVELPLQ